MNSAQSSRRGRMSVMSSATATTSRRGHTPSKLPNDPQQPETKPKLSLQQQLEIFERFEKGDYKNGLEIYQSYKQPKTPATPVPRTNLMREFEKLQDSKIPAGGDPIFSSTILASKEKSEELLEPAHKQWMEENSEDYAKLPKYLKDFDRILVLYENYARNLLQIADLKVEANFEQLFPHEEIGTLFTKMDKMVVTLNKFLSKPIREKKLLLEEQQIVIKLDKTNKGPAAIRCDVRTQEKFMESLKKIPDLLDQMRPILIKLNGNPLWADKFNKAAKMINTLEEGLQTLSVRQIEVKKVLQLIENLEIDELTDDSGTNSDASTSMSSVGFSPV